MSENTKKYNGRRIGYLRCSRPDQSHDRQIDGLTPYCDEMHLESVSAVAPKRPVFDAIIAELQAGDALVVWDIDRAFRSSVDALLIEARLRKKGVFLHLVKIAIDTSTAEGEFVFTLLSAATQYERRMLSRRTKEGLAAVRERGQRLGRPPKLSEAQVSDARRRIEAKSATIKALAAEYKVNPWTLTRSLRRCAFSTVS